MELSELVVSRCGQWMGNREFIWSGHISKRIEKGLAKGARNFHWAVCVVTMKIARKNT